MIELWTEFSNSAVEAAMVGGEILERYFRNVDQETVEAKTSNDWVSEADHASEKAIISFLKNKYPDHGFYSEEVGYLPPASGDESYCWIIDPLDGTTNFLRGFPLWAVSIGLERRTLGTGKWGEIVAGAVCVPPTGEIFRAVAGGGAFRNGRKFTIGMGHELKQSLLGTGFPFRVPDLLPHHLRVFSELLLNCADVRRPGAAAIDLCYTAMGVYDGFWEFDLFPWDLAAGIVIIREAGGIMSGIRGEDDMLTTGDVLTAHPRIYPRVLEITQRGLTANEFPRQVDKSPNR